MEERNYYKPTRKEEREYAVINILRNLKNIEYLTKEEKDKILESLNNVQINNNKKTK